MKIKDVMSRNVIVVDINTSLQEIAKIMKENDTGFLPVSEEKKIIGVITDRDIVIRILANGDNQLKGYLSTNLVTIDYGDSIENALTKMKENKVKRLLVKDNHKLKGVISLSDLINQDSENLIDSLKVIWEINRNTDTYETKIDEFEL